MYIQDFMSIVARMNLADQEETTLIPCWYHAWITRIGTRMGWHYIHLGLGGTLFLSLASFAGENMNSVVKK